VITIKVKKAIEAMLGFLIIIKSDFIVPNMWA
jgi:hypothetical protein